MRTRAATREVRQKGFDFERPQFGGVTLAVKPDEAFNPVEIGLLGTNAVVLDSDFVADAVEQPRTSGGFHVQECAPFCRPHYWERQR